MAEPRTPCGPHDELARSESFRVTRCPCGTLHLYLAKAGVTVQLPSGSLPELLRVAASAEEALSKGAPRPSSAPAATN